MTHSILGMGGILSLPSILILIAGVAIIIVMAIIGALLTIRKVKAGEAGVRTGLGGLKVPNPGCCACLSCIAGM